jgi:uncharacterized membrane protein
MKTIKTAASLALAAATLFATLPLSVSAAGAAGHCEGVNACKSHGSCKSGGNACKGQNACKGKGFVVVDEATCGQMGGKFSK